LQLVYPNDHLFGKIIDQTHYMPKLQDAEQILEDKITPTRTSATV
jgi:hypothetical protein